MIQNRGDARLESVKRRLHSRAWSPSRRPARPRPVQSFDGWAVGDGGGEGGRAGAGLSECLPRLAAEPVSLPGQMVLGEHATPGQTLDGLAVSKCELGPSIEDLDPIDEVPDHRRRRRHLPLVGQLAGSSRSPSDHDIGPEQAHDVVHPGKRRVHEFEIELPESEGIDPARTRQTIGRRY
ncbi:hypothetical protein D3C72_870130 [compost metagenome]